MTRFLEASLLLRSIDPRGRPDRFLFLVELHLHDRAFSACFLGKATTRNIELATVVHDEHRDTFREMYRNPLINAG